MPHIFTRPRAEADVLEIWRDIAQDRPTNADRLLERIRDTLSRLAARPLMGRPAVISPQACACSPSAMT